MTARLVLTLGTAKSISAILMPLVVFAFCHPVRAAAQSNSNEIAQVSRSTLPKGKSACLIEITSPDFVKGDYIEIIGNNEKRIGLAKAGRSSSKNRTTRALVIDGTKNCKIYKGKLARRVNFGENSFSSQKTNPAQKAFFIIPQYVVTQHTVPGLALNKFISPSYNQKGFGLRVSGVFPKTPLQISSYRFKTRFSAAFEQAQTSPALDLFREGVVIGSQSIVSTLINAQGGIRSLFAGPSAWAEIGAVLYESLTSKSSLKKTSNDEAELFQAIRDVSGSKFGLYLALGIVMSNSAEISLHSGIGLGGKYTTPIIEDGNFTNTSSSIKTNGIPIFAGTELRIPLMEILYAEVGLEYKNTPLLIPLINDEISKAQFESLSVRVGAGLQL